MEKKEKQEKKDLDKEIETADIACFKIINPEDWWSRVP